MVLYRSVDYYTLQNLKCTLYVLTILLGFREIFQMTTTEEITRTVYIRNKPTNRTVIAGDIFTRSKIGLN